jgi:hypothetical protein
MSSFQDQNLPVISFIARPVDSRKGLQTFLDAVSLITLLYRIPLFSCWIIGGTSDETEYIHNMIEWRPPLRELFAQGRIILWGRVSHESLPEFYSRSSVVVMPSSREQFGLTAIETMMCGRPIIATEVGGLRDAIVDDSTGTLVASHDSALFASALAGYLRNPQRQEYLGKNAATWARFAFSKEKAYAGFLDLYQNRSSSPASTFYTYSELRQQKLEELAALAAESVNKRVLRIKDLSCSGHFSLLIETDDGKYFAKGYALDPTTDGSVFCLPTTLNPARTFEEYASRCKFHQANPAAPQPTDYVPEAHLIIFEWGDPILQSSVQSSGEVEALIKMISNAYRNYRPLNLGDLSEYSHRLAAFSENQAEETLLDFDYACARLNAREFVFPCLRFAQTHPQIELYRYQQGLNCGDWVIPESFSIRAGAIISHLLSIYPILPDSPSVCNGSLKEEHLLNGRRGIFACDIDSSRYVVGPYDESHYVYKRVLREGIGPTAALANLHAMTGDRKEFYLGVCWLVADLLYEALAGLIRGKNNGLGAFMRFAHDFHATAWKSIGNDET